MTQYQPSNIETASRIKSISRFKRMKGVIKMKKYLALAKYGNLMRMVFTNDINSKELIGKVHDAISGFPVDTIITPTGKCNTYRTGNAWITVCNNITIEVVEHEITDIEVHVDFEDDESIDNIKDYIYLTFCYIIGYIIVQDSSVYKNLIMPYLEKIVVSGYENNIDIDRYKKFSENELKINKISDHISISDLMFNVHMHTYLESEGIINITVLDVTNIDRIFDKKESFSIE